MSKFTQICASQNDLFSLDEEGEVFHYDFNLRSWVQLAGERMPAETRDDARLEKRNPGSGLTAGERPEP